jgi:ABC-type glycerol-3-phosphate transport system permease component
VQGRPPALLAGDSRADHLQVEPDEGQYYTDWSGMMSMSLLFIIPMLLVFMFFQRYFIQGIASTGM